MTIHSIYQTYQIPPNLERHMLEVTAVGRYIADHWQGPVVDKELITQALLLHDMGNIIKFRQPFLGEMAEQANYWSQVQQAFKQKYGEKVHPATEHIIKEIIINPDKIMKILGSIGFETVQKNGYPSWETRICDHADMCVAPWGICTFQDRIEDLKKRYDQVDEGLSQRLENAKIIQQHVDVDLEKLPEGDFSEEVNNLKTYDFEVV